MNTDNFCDLQISGLERYSLITSSEFNLGGNISWDLDKDPEFLLSPEDPRYQACLKKAHELKAAYPLTGFNPQDPDQKQLLVERERMIVMQVTNAIHEQYGDYNTAIATGADSRTHPSMHGDVTRQNTRDPAHLSEFKKDELICRHFAPLASSLCHEAGVSNLLVDGFNNSFVAENNTVEAIPNSTGQFNRHSFVVSRLTGNVIEATTKGDFSYKQSINGISIGDFIAGGTIVTANHEQSVTSYGTGLTGSSEQQSIYRKRREKIAQGRYTGLENYDALKSIDDDIIQIKQVCEADLQTAQAVYSEKIRPSVERFDAAVQAGDTAALCQCCSEIPISKGKLASALNQAMRTQNTSMASWLLDKGAMEGYRGAINPSTLLMTAGIYSAPRVGAGRAPLNKDFIKTMMGKMNVAPEDYLKEMARIGAQEHAEIAVEELAKLPATPERKRILLGAGKSMKIAAISELLEGKYQNVTAAEDPADLFAGTNRRRGEPTPAHPAATGAMLPAASITGAGMLALLGGVVALISGAGMGTGLLLVIGGLLSGALLGAMVGDHSAKEHPAAPVSARPTHAPAQAKAPEPQVGFGELLQSARPVTAGGIIINEDSLRKASVVIDAMDGGKPSAPQPPAPQALPFNKQGTDKTR